MPTIGNAPLGEDISLDGTEKIPATGSKYILISMIRDYIWNYLTSLTAKTTLADADQLSIADSAASNVAGKITWINVKAAIKTYTDTLYAAVGSGGGDGWTAGTGTWSYSSADDPTFVISVNNDQTGIIGVGDRIKLTQTTAKYFLVTAVGAYGGGATLITIYGGTDYDLANAAITTPYWSKSYSPLGFPMSPIKWTVTLTDITLQTQATPTQNTWYNPGSLSLSMPIGAWDVYYKVFVQGGDASAVNVGLNASLSTANNSESDADMTSYVIASIPAGSTHGAPVTVKKTIVVTSKTSYYCVARTISAGLDNLYFANNAMGLVVRFESAYL